MKVISELSIFKPKKNDNTFNITDQINVSRTVVNLALTTLHSFSTNCLDLILRTLPFFIDWVGQFRMLPFTPLSA